MNTNGLSDAVKGDVVQTAPATPDITIVIPCLNEEATILPTLDTVCDAMEEFSYSFEIIVIDDGSTDNTALKVEEYRLRHPNVDLTVHSNPRNLGLATSYVNGSFIGRGKYYKLVCGDHTEPKKALTDVMSHLGEADIIIAYPIAIEGKSPFRMGVSRLYTWLVNVISGHNIKYYNGAAIHLRYNVMRWGPYSFGFGFQAELITRLLDEGDTYVEIPVVARHVEKNKRNSALNWRNFLSVGHTLLELAIRRVRRTTIGR
jgi:glycosyltransferase involved in cell wall biosynthesis